MVTNKLNPIIIIIVHLSSIDRSMEKDRSTGRSALFRINQCVWMHCRTNGILYRKTNTHAYRERERDVWIAFALRYGQFIESIKIKAVKYMRYHHEKQSREHVEKNRKTFEWMNWRMTERWSSWWVFVHTCIYARVLAHSSLKCIAATIEQQKTQQEHIVSFSVVLELKWFCVLYDVVAS